MDKPRLRTAIIGTGFIGRIHLEAVRRLGIVDVAAISSIELDVARKLAEEFGVERVEEDYQKVLADPTIQAVHVCSPNAQHFPMASGALSAGKHVICEKPLATSTADAAALVKLAAEKKLRNCTCHNLRYYPMVQQMRRMCEAGELGDVLIAQGTYSQDWLLYDTDWNWRVDSKHGGRLRALGDIGSHWCDMVEHVTGLRITSLCAELATFHKTRKRPKGDIATFDGKTRRPEDFEEAPVDTEDFASVMIHLGSRARGAFTVSQVSAGCKNRLSVEIYGTKASVRWNGERPEELWIGRRDRSSEILLKDPALLAPKAKGYADLPGGHSEGYDDTFKQVFRRFYQSISQPGSPAEYPQFSDGLRQMKVLDAELASSQKRAWVDVAAD